MVVFSEEPREELVESTKKDFGSDIPKEEWLEDLKPLGKPRVDMSLYTHCLY
jgi:hypothetical protein